MQNDGEKPREKKGRKVMKVGKIMLVSGAVLAAIGFLFAVGLACDSDVFGAPMSYLTIRVALAAVLMAGGYVVARIGQNKMEG